MTTQVDNIHIQGNEHWTKKGDAKLFLWEKRRAQDGAKNGHHPVRARLVDGLAADLRPAGAGAAASSRWTISPSAGFDTWSMDMEGYGRSTKDRGIDATISEGADDLKAGTDYIFKTRNHTGPLLVYGISSGALRAALFAQRHPEPGAAARARRPCLDRRRQPDAGRAPQEAAGVSQDQAAADRPHVRALDLRARPSRHRRRQRDRGVRRRTSWSSTTRSRTAPTSTCATTCRWSIRPRSRCRPSSCVANTTASPASRTCSISSKSCPIPDKQFAVMPGIAHASLPAEELP